MFAVVAVLFFLTTNVMANPAPKILVKGVYLCAKPKKHEPCPQEVIPKYTDQNSLLWLKVSYVGDCGNDGPYYYYCDPLTSICVDGLVEFHITAKNKYSWANRQYDIACDFKLKKRISP